MRSLPVIDPDAGTMSASVDHVLPTRRLSPGRQRALAQRQFMHVELDLIWREPQQ
jgi:hypothetical protein